MGSAIIFFIIGIVGLLYSSVFTVHKSTAGAMGAKLLKIVARIVGVICLVVGGVLLLGAIL